MSFNNISFILHQPQLSENIGACARAIKNFNFKKLVIINPKPTYPNDKILATSVGAKDIVTNSKVYENLEHAVKKVDYVMWGETDSFFPKEAFHVIETLSEYTTKENIHKYLLSFSDRKMWDSSWDPLVHKDYEHLEFIDDDEGHLNPNQAKSQLSIEKMNEINAKAKEFEFTYINKPKISGACLVLSADLIKSGVNIPSCLIYNDDEGLSIMCEKLLGNQFIQFICKNVLHIHARRHPQKRCYVANENNPNAFINQKVDTFQKFLQLSKANVQRLITGKDKFYEYDDFEKELQ